MNKTTLTASALVIGVAAIAYYKWQTYLSDLETRFPEIDRKVIRKAYRQFMKNSAANKYGDMSNFSDVQMDLLFLEIVRDQSASK